MINSQKPRESAALQRIPGIFLLEVKVWQAE